MIVTSGLAAVVLALNHASAGPGMLDDFTVPQSLTAPAGEVVSQIAGNGGTSCWYISGCFRELVIDNTGSRHATSVSTRYNPDTPTIGPNFELVTHVEAGDAVTIQITWDADTVMGNFGSIDPDVHFEIGRWVPAFFPHMHASSSRPGNPTVRITLKHDDGQESFSELSDFSEPAYRPDGYVAPQMLPDPCARPSDGNDEPRCIHLQGMRFTLTVLASDEPLDFALRRLSVPEPPAAALVPAAMVLLFLARWRRQAPRVAPLRLRQGPGPRTYCDSPSSITPKAP